jgi:hypothetical protein
VKRREKIRSNLEAARQFARTLPFLPFLPYVVTGAFAGLRPSELEWLDWSNVSFEMGNSPKMVFEHYREIVTPGQETLREGGKTYRLRKAGAPEELQKSIYDKLDVKWDRLPDTKLEVETEAIL